MSAARSWYAPVVTRLRTTNPYVVDSALAVLVLFAASLQWMFPDEGDDRLSLVGWLLGAATAVPLVWRRRSPYACALAVSAATTAMAYYHAPPPDVLYGGFVVLYTMAAQGLPWQRRTMLASWLLGAVLTMQHKEHSEPFEYAFHLTGMICAYGLGVLARVQRAYTAAVEDRAGRLERERAAETARAIAQERSRIARDMHDILAHAVSLMVVQAEAGPVVVRSDPDRAEAAFDAIAASGRDAMAQLRRILGVLKEEERRGGAARLPQPDLAGLPDLVRQVSDSTELHVALTVRGRPRPLPPDTEVAAYRAVQEALTNTVKHAYASCAQVELDWAEDELTLTVTDDGRGPARSDGGHGLIGLRERAAACGGSAETGTGPGGGLPGRRTTARRRGPGSGPRVSIRVVVADDQELVRSGFSMILEAQQDIEVVAEAGDGAEAVDAVRRHTPRRAAPRHPDAGHGRHGGGPAGVRAVELQGGHADHVRPRRVRVRRALRGGQRLPAQGRAPGRPRARGPRGGGRRLAARAGRHPPPGRRHRAPPPRGGRHRGHPRPPGRPDRPRGGDPADAGPRPVQRGDRRRRCSSASTR